jgi:nucleolar pre-ribosomal-associated protein 2
VESDDARFITRSIEKLIALHIILPARSLFMERGGSGIDYSKAEDPDWSAVQPVTATFKPLFEDRSSVDIKCNGTDTSSVDQNSCIFPATWKPAELIPTFYDIVARSVPRDSFRRQNTEASWLETVFVALAELAYSRTQQLGGNTAGFHPLLEQLFIVVRARKINLSLHTFLTHASYTGLLRGKEDPQLVRWSLTTLLIELGADIFLPNSGFKDSGRLLDALFQSLHHVRSDMSNQETYQLVKVKVVIPLLRAFAAARDLPTFAGFWYEQLREIEVARNDSTYSVWEDDDVLLVYQEVLKSTISDIFLKSQIETAISSVTKSGHVSKSPESYAYFVILEAGTRIWGQSGLPGLRIDLVTNLMEALHKTLSKRKGDRHWLWRLWRVARNLMPISLKSTLNTPNELADKFKREALVVANFSTGPTKLRSGWNGHQESFEACQFLLSLSKELYHGTSPERKDILHVIINCLTGSFSSIIEAKLEGWNGRYQDIHGLAQQATAVIECLLEHPNLLSELAFEDLKCFVKFLWDLTSSSSKDWKQQIPEITECVSFKQLWRVFLSYDYLTDSPSLASGVARSLCELFMEMVESHQTQPVIVRYLPGIMQDLPGIPVRHGEVPKFKDTVEALLTKVDCPADFVPYMVSLMNGWCQESRQVGPEILEWITSDISLQDSPVDMRTIESFRSLIRTVFECEYKACKSPAEVGKFLKRFYKLTTSRVESSTTQLGIRVKDKDRLSTLTPIFVGTSLRLLWEKQGFVSKILDDVALQREKIFGLLLIRLDNCSKTLRRKSHTEAAVLLATTYQMLEDFDDLAAQHNTELDKPSTELEEHELVLNDGIKNIAQRRKIARAATSNGLGFNDSTLLQGIGLCRMQACEQTYLAREFTTKLKHMNNADRIKAIDELKAAGLEGTEGASRLLLGGLAVSVLDEIAEKDSAEARAVSSLCTAATNILQHSIDEIEQFSLAAESIDIILRLHPRGVTQYNIDSCLTAVTTTMSNIHSLRETSHISTKSLSTIYTRLCRILGTIVGLYRQQLGGRFHLLIPALQSLLKALFAPNQKRNQKAGLALGVPHTVQFTRLLTSLCDPTVSAVSRPNRPTGNSSNSLIDQTKKAKVIAGQHLRILIESYAQNMLEAPLQPDIKTALAPGLYAILDAMPAESKRGLNAGMDISSRAIFKTLHEEYVRFGKWNSKG